jgi:hypothetical protein
MIDPKLYMNNLRMVPYIFGIFYLEIQEDSHQRT